MPSEQLGLTTFAEGCMLQNTDLVTVLNPDPLPEFESKSGNQSFSSCFLLVSFFGTRFVAIEMILSQKERVTQRLNTYVLVLPTQVNTQTNKQVRK